MAMSLIDNDRIVSGRAPAAPFRRAEAPPGPCWWDWSAVVLVAVIMLVLSAYIFG
jgi:hypothetical protein